MFWIPSPEHFTKLPPRVRVDTCNHHQRGGFCDVAGYDRFLPLTYPTTVYLDNGGIVPQNPGSVDYPSKWLACSFRTHSCCFGSESLAGPMEWGIPDLFFIFFYHFFSFWSWKLEYMKIQGCWLNISIAVKIRAQPFSWSRSRDGFIAWNLLLALRRAVGFCEGNHCTIASHCSWLNWLNVQFRSSRGSGMSATSPSFLLFFCVDWSKLVTDLLRTSERRPTVPPPWTDGPNHESTNCLQWWGQKLINLLHWRVPTRILQVCLLSMDWVETGQRLSWTEKKMKKENHSEYSIEKSSSKWMKPALPRNIFCWKPFLLSREQTLRRRGNSWSDSKPLSEYIETVKQTELMLAWWHALYTSHVWFQWQAPEHLNKVTFPLMHPFHSGMWIKTASTSTSPKVRNP